MAYNQSSLKNIGDIKEKILKGKTKTNTNMSTQEMKDVVSERLRQDMTGPQSIRQVRNSIVQDVTITPGSPGKSGYIPEGKGTSMKDIKTTKGYKSQKAIEFKQKGKADRSNKTKIKKTKTGGSSGGVIREKGGGLKRALIGLGTMATIALGATALFGTHRSYGSENTKNLGGN